MWICITGLKYQKIIKTCTGIRLDFKKLNVVMSSQWGNVVTLVGPLFKKIDLETHSKILSFHGSVEFLKKNLSG